MRWVAYNPPYEEIFSFSPDFAKAPMAASSIPFLRRFLTAPQQVGAVLPSSRGLARALVGPFANCKQPARVLEVGAGTGPVTAELARLIGPQDHIDVCEIDEHFAGVLREKYFTTGPLADAAHDGRARLLNQPVQAIEGNDRYDFIISGLPLNGFEPKLVKDILVCIQRLLKPGGTYSYFEYAAARGFLRYSIKSTTRKRVTKVSSIVDALINAHEVDRQLIFLNVPPAYARHLVFEKNDS